MSAIWHASGNFGPRRDGLVPKLVVLHYTAMVDAKSALARLCDPKVEVSAHYLIGCDGTLWQMVNEDMRAWHAGAGEWAGQGDINSRSIGVELDNRGDHPFGEPQMQVLTDLLGEILARWSIPASGVIGHSDMAPGRKSDPGPRFDWDRLARLGLAAQSVSGQPCTPDRSQFRTRALARGFTAAVSDDCLLDAVRLRFRPWAKGPLCARDMAALGGVLR